MPSSKCGVMCVLRYCLVGPPCATAFSGLAGGGGGAEPVRLEVVGGATGGVWAAGGASEVMVERCSVAGNEGSAASGGGCGSVGSARFVWVSWRLGSSVGCDVFVSLVRNGYSC